MSKDVTFLCITNYFKGQEFLRECHRLGVRTVLITKIEVRDKPWPDCIDERFYVKDVAVLDELIPAVSYLARTRQFDVIVPLDDYAVETAAALREHLRCPGMGESTARYFRDKLAMRIQAREKGLKVPEFVHVLNHQKIQEYTERVRPPWLVKPRSEAGSVQIRKFDNTGDLWEWINFLGDRASHHLLEAYISGEVFHVDSVVYDSEVLFAAPHRYWKPPFNIWNEGGIFTSQSIPDWDPLYEPILQMNRAVIQAMGLPYGVTHAEFIQSELDGELYFLEIAARCGGAFIDELIYAETGVHMWREWARIEACRVRKHPYSVHKERDLQGGLLLCLSRQENPDLSAYDAPEVVWKHEKGHHAGLVVVSEDSARVTALMEKYGHMLSNTLLAVKPPTEKPA